MNGSDGAAADQLRRLIRDIPDFPTPGILFRDITPVLADARAFAAAIDLLASPWKSAGVTHVAAIESRGFVLGAPVALALGAGLILVRKVGKLPSRTEREQYELEYGSAVLEIHADAVGAGDRVLIVDDVLATGGTAAAACRLVTRMGATVAGCAFLLEIEGLDGAARLTGRRFTRILSL
jgi:adenine phosphoribosyltransferase